MHKQNESEKPSVVNQPQYIFEASSKPSLLWHEVPLIWATEISLNGYGQLVDDPADLEIEIIRWPQQEWRPVDEGGFVERKFMCDKQPNKTKV